MVSFNKEKTKQSKKKQSVSLCFCYQDNIIWRYCIADFEDLKRHKAGSYKLNNLTPGAKKIMRPIKKALGVEQAGETVTSETSAVSDMADVSDDEVSTVVESHEDAALTDEDKEEEATNEETTEVSNEETVTTETTNEDTVKEVIQVSSEATSEVANENIISQVATGELTNEHTINTANKSKPKTDVTKEGPVIRKVINEKTVSAQVIKEENVTNKKATTVKENMKVSVILPDGEKIETQIKEGRVDVSAAKLPPNPPKKLLPPAKTMKSTQQFK